MNNAITMKTIDDLLSCKFLVADYQRGYRWTDVQVTNLLDDLWEFNNKEKSKEEFYCLQPVVVAKRPADGDVVWELIDGQQRLTTIYIILSFFNSRFAEGFRNRLYEIEYQTRTDSGKYLADINEQDREKNIDYYHFYGALYAVRTWFAKKTSYINEIETVLLTKTRVIWYEVHEAGTMPVDIFTRINIGKIPLTNAELIRALFLQRNNFESQKAYLKQLQIASEWDRLEAALQDDSFWFFLYDPKSKVKYENRIEFIFDLMKGRGSDSEFYFTYNKFHDDFRLRRQDGNLPDIDGMWQEIKKYFETFQGWYRDRKLYHLLGYLVDCGHHLRDLKTNSENKSKTDFLSYVTSLIRKEVACQLHELSYGEKKIKKVLLLFNIQTMLATQKADMRFPFHTYKNEDWDIEHVRSQTDRTIAPNTRKAWALDMLEYFTGEEGYSDEPAPGSNGTRKDAHREAISRLPEERQKQCKTLLTILDADKVEDKVFQKLFEELTEEFKEGKVEKGGISNLALLDATTNRSYKNAMFPIKRKTIIQNDMKGVFVPICTKNLFLKFYSKQVGDVMYWQNTDADHYLQAIRLTLKDYLPQQGGAQ